MKRGFLQIGVIGALLLFVVTNFYALVPTATQTQEKSISASQKMQPNNIIELGTDDYVKHPPLYGIHYMTCKSLYFASEINGKGGTPGVITSISYLMDTPITYIFDGPVSIYVEPTTCANLSNTEAQAAPNNLVYSVASGFTISRSSPGWFTIALQTPYAYDGSHNILITTVTESTNPGGNVSIWSTSQGYPYSTMRRLVAYSDTNPNPGNWEYSALFPHIQFDLTASVTPVVHVTFQTALSSGRAARLRTSAGAS
jgi:hypothetical protein